ncbi:MAG: hypothetical protein ABSG45_04110 [Nitrososphaerales archaeon]
MIRRTMLLLALVLGIIGAIIFILGASQQAECSPAGTGCTSINYTPVYAGVAILAASVVIALASRRSKPQTTSHESTLQLR